MRVASQKVFCTAARTAPTAISTATESVSEAVTRETARPATMPRTTRTTVWARRAYGRLCPYSAQSEPAIVYITRSSRSREYSSRFGTAEATTTLSAGLYQVSTGLFRRRVPVSGSLGADVFRDRTAVSLTHTR